MGINTFTGNCICVGCALGMSAAFALIARFHPPKWLGVIALAVGSLIGILAGIAFNIWILWRDES